MTRDLRALMLIDGLGWGGAEMLLAEFVAGAGDAGIEVLVGYLREKDGNPAADRLRALGVEPFGTPIGGLLHRASLDSVRNHIAAVRPDIVHTHLGYSDFLGGRAARALGIPAISTIHLAGWEAACRDALKLALCARARRRCMSRVVAVSDAAREAYLAKGWDRPERVVTVHNGVAGIPCPNAGAAVRAQLGIGPRDVVVAMLSVLRPGKGHDVAIAAIDALRATYPDLRLLVLGDGPLREGVAALAAPLGDAVVLGGHRQDVMRVLDAVDILLHPSGADAFPTALLEAMAASVPVVATAVGGIPEIVLAEETGVLIPVPADPGNIAGALAPLLADPARRRRLGAAGRARFERHFSASSWAERTRALYDAVLAEHGRPVMRQPFTHAGVSSARRMR